MNDVLVILLILLVVGWGLYFHSTSTQKTDREYEKLLRNLDYLNAWDGVERQIELMTKNRDMAKLSKNEQFSVRWRIKYDRLISVDLNTVEINRRYWKSGLSPEDFAKEYYSQLAITESRAKFNAAPEYIHLYDKSGEYVLGSRQSAWQAIKEDEEAQQRTDMIAMIRRSPEKVFTQWTEEINDGNIGIRSSIDHIHLLKNGYYPYHIGALENGERKWVYLTFKELWQELDAEYSIYELKDFRFDHTRIINEEKDTQKDNMTKLCKRTNKEIKDYLWKRYHEMIVAADAEEAFAKWSYKFDKKISFEDGNEDI